MSVSDSDFRVLLAVTAFALTICLLAELNERHAKKSYMYHIDSHAVCACSHRGYEHSYRTGVCRFEAIIAGVLFRCPCAEFRHTTHTEELV